MSNVENLLHNDMTYDTINDAMTMQGGTQGALLAGRYRVVRQLGQGGMGSVWLAEDTLLDNKQFAIKMLPSILVSNKRAYRQLKDEALVAMQLVHPNIVQIRAFEENNGNPFLVMDYVDGETLDDYLAEHCEDVDHVERVERGSGGLPEDEAIRILKPIAAALDYAHTKGVVHRDVKPGNVMVAKDGTPYILDFGIAREIQETMTRVTGKLSSGTLLYMSPEQLNGDPPKPAQDVYSFAAMAYECLKGEPPFSRGQIEHQILNNPPPPLAGTSGSLASSVMSGLAKKPEDRPATCAGVLSGDVLTQSSRDAKRQRANSNHVEHVKRVEGVVRNPAAPSTDAGDSVAPKRNVSGIALPIFCIVAALAVLGGVVCYREAQWREVARKRAVAMQQDELRKKAEEEKRREEDDRRKKAREAQLAREKENALRAKESVSEIRVESRSQKGRVDRISGEDGFKRKIDNVSDMFVRAEALYDESRWHDAAVAYTNYVRRCDELVELDGERQSATQSRKKAQTAFQNAEAEGAKIYARDSWNAAVNVWQKAAGEFGRMEFSAAAASFEDAARRFAESGQAARGNKRIAEEKKAREKLEEEPGIEAKRWEEAACQAEERRKAMQSLPGKCSTITDFFANDPNYVCCTDVVFAPVYFDFNSSVVPQGEFGKINVVAQHLNSHPERVVMLDGNCDERGSNEYSLSLGEGRSCAVRECLIKDGVDPKKIQTRSYGKEKPAVIGRDESTWAMNRRCEFVVFEHKVVDLQDDSSVLQADDNGFNSISVSSRVHSMDNNSKDGDFAFLSPTDVMYLILRSTSQCDADLVSRLVCTKSFKIPSEEQIRSEYLGFGDDQKQQNMRAFLKEALKVTIIQQKVLNDNNAEVLTMVPKSEVKRIFRSFGQSISKPEMDMREVYQCKKINGRWRVAVLPD